MAGKMENTASDNLFLLAVAFIWFHFHLLNTRRPWHFQLLYTRLQDFPIITSLSFFPLFPLSLEIDSKNLFGGKLDKLLHHPWPPKIAQSTVPGESRLRWGGWDLGLLAKPWCIQGAGWNPAAVHRGSWSASTFYLLRLAGKESLHKIQTHFQGGRDLWTLLSAVFIS